MTKDMSCLLAVNGTLMRGLALEKNLLDVGAVFCREAQTAACYRLWSIRDEYPAMLRVAPGDPAGASIAVDQMREIACYGGWRAYLAATKN